MPAVDDPFGLAASLPGQLADLRRQIKDLSSNNTQAASQAIAAATAAAAAATAASNAATTASGAATTASNAATASAGAATTASNAATTASNAATTASGAATTASNAATVASTAATNAQVAPGVGSSGITGFTLSTVYATLTSFTITVPSGYTRGLISVSVFASSTTATTGPNDRVYVRAITNGAPGTEGIAVMSPGLPSAAASAFQSQNLTGLTGGSVISIGVQAHLAVGPGVALYTNATVSAMAIFQV